jgi:tetratricopeptide (TPR) repeat protein
MMPRSVPPQDALVAVDRALAHAPGDPALLLRRAHCLLALGRPQPALEAAAAAQRHAPADAALLDAIGTLYSRAGEQLRALASYDQAIALSPDHAPYLFNRAAVLRFVGRLAEAEADYDRVVALQPADYEAYKNRSDLRTQSVAHNHVEELERVLASLRTGGDADGSGEVQLRYALAKEYEDLDECERSFRHLELGARRRRAQLGYDVAVDVATVDWIIEAFPAAPGRDAAGTVHTVAPASHTEPVPAAAAAETPEQARVSAIASLTERSRGVAPVGEDAPIFIVGLPRSGTTLVERILGSHSTVTSAGELNCFALSLMAAVQRHCGGVRLPRRELVAQSAHIDFAGLGRDYLDRARAAVPAGRFTDKMPLNYLYCGLIRRALPQARMVHVRRHPMAAGYAMYKSLFRDGYPFSYDLNDIARYYAGYRRLMDHWQAVLPGAILSLDYERLVADQAGETRRLLDFCGLAWEDACAQFHLNPAPTTTASAAQVRRPIYDTAVAQWRRYEVQLAPLRQAFDALGVRVPP